jgi:hypothetical protein
MKNTNEIEITLHCHGVSGTNVYVVKDATLRTLLCTATTGLDIRQEKVDELMLQRIAGNFSTASMTESCADYIKARRDIDLQRECVDGINKALNDLCIPGTVHSYL